MTISFLPGEPNKRPNAVDTAYWNEIRLVVYCSGNNLIILDNTTVLLQTVYLPQDGNAVKIDPKSGRIVVACGTQVMVLSPLIMYDRPPKWELAYGIHEADEVTAVAWSNSNEIVTGSASLNVWLVPGDMAGSHEEPRLIWSKRLANAVDCLTVSPDSMLVATIAKNDRLVKVWRRLSFDVDNTAFDFIYLPHPSPVKLLKWKQPLHASQSIDNSLYTEAKDKVLRLWSPFDSSDSSNLQLWASIDMRNCQMIEDGVKCDPIPFIIDSDHVAKAIESTVKRTPATPELVQLAKKQCEIVCVLFGSKMSVYTIENARLRGKGHELTRVEKIMDKVTVLSATRRHKLDANFTSLRGFATMDPKVEEDISILVHDMKVGALLHYGLLFDVFLKPTHHHHHRQHHHRLFLKSILTGHNKSVQRIMRAADGESLLSLSRFTENMLWRPQRVESGVTMKRVSIIQGHINQAALVSGGKYLISLLDTKQLVLWDCRVTPAIEIATIKVDPPSSGSNGEAADPLALFLLPEEAEVSCLHLIAVNNRQDVRMWAVKLPSRDSESGKIELAGTFELPTTDSIKKAVVVDPVGWRATLGRTLDVYQRDVLVTVSDTGQLRSWTALVSEAEGHHIEWLESGNVETGLTDIEKVQVSSTRKVATSNAKGTHLAIWDMRNELLEFEEEFSEQNTISDLDWTSTPDAQSVLGVGFAKQVVLYCELRFDYTNKTSSWAPFKRVDISPFTSHPIGDSIWLQNGTFVVGAGNQFFIQDEKVDVYEDSTTRNLLGTRNTISADEKKGHETSIFDIVAVINGPLPIYHPQLLIQSIFAGKIHIVKRVLLTLLRKLKFTPVLEPSMIIQISSDLGMDAAKVFSSDLFDSDSGMASEASSHRALFRRQSFSTESIFDDSVSEQLGDWLQRVTLPYLTRHQQITLASVVEALNQIEVHRRSLDSNGVNYLLGYRLYKIHRGIQESMSMRDFNWALHSENQDILFELVEKSTSGPLLWPVVREVGFPYWLRKKKLIELFEKLGRNYFSTDGKRDPVACTLYYLALKKKQILVGLWRTASWHKEQAKTIKLLSNDFSEPRWKSAALKNAFALLGKHRFEYAASFFLLGDSLKDAVSVLVRQVKDIPLAIAVARVYEGEGGPVLKNLIETEILPKARDEGDRWTLSWGLWATGNRKEAIEALAGYDAESDVEKSAAKSLVAARGVKSFLTDDPVLIELYRWLRDNQATYGGIDSKDGDLPLDQEFYFVLKTASIYSRMGCDVLALDLLKQWQFRTEKSSVPATPTPEEKVTTPTGAPMESSVSLNEKVAETPKSFANLKPAAAVAFQEPDMSSFSFGM
ncbi:regulator of V-ATPase in vacuolar membrane protein 1 [Trichomonascus vanleenenianus]|uniref:Rav1p n=1 Tax=Trichomonascus vanleenenianus TaxID=2268995 RepID=UPI003EC9C816